MSKAEPSWELYRTFLAVVREGSLSAAARGLGLAQPTARRRIEELEEALDVVLFTRASNGLVPTEAAIATVPHAEAMAAAAQAMVRTLSAPADAERGTVRITASEIVGVEVLPGLLAPLLAVHPLLQVEIVATNRSQDMLRRDADIAIRMIAPTQSSLVARRAATIPVGLFASTAYLAKHPAPRRPSELREHALVGADTQRGLIDALAASGIVTTRRDFVVRTDSDVAQLAAVRAGIGIGVCQVPLAARTHALVRVLSAFEVPLGAWVVMHEDQRTQRRVRLVFDHLFGELAAYAVGEATLLSSKRRAAASPPRHRAR
ncbi:MAG: LysR family transcriptional regulator [Myxococcales bacterium]|nr:LysR family transcriptional regulator [Myxococcales bacterium]